MAVNCWIEDLKQLLFVVGVTSVYTSDVLNLFPRPFFPLSEGGQICLHCRRRQAILLLPRLWLALFIPVCVSNNFPLLIVVQIFLFFVTDGPDHDDGLVATLFIFVLALVLVLRSIVEKRHVFRWAVPALWTPEDYVALP